MVIRSIIAMKNGNVITAIYCHWHGYLENNGVILYNHYNTIERVKQLLALGDISVLNEYISCDEIESNVPLEHSYDKPYPNVTVAYHRDRGEELSIKHYNQRQFNRMLENSWVEYVYLFDGKDWKYKLNKKKSRYLNLGDSVKMLD